MRTALVALLCLAPLAVVVSLFARPRLAQAATVCASAGAFGLTIALALAARHGRVISALHGWLRLDSLGAVFMLATGFLYVTSAVFSVGYLGADRSRRDFEGFARRYFTYLNLFAWTMLIVTAASDFGTLWIAVELTTIVSALMVALDRTDAALEASWRYVLIASTGLGLALLAIIVIYGAGTHALGNSYLPRFSSFLRVAPSLSHGAVKVSFLLAAIGFGTKVGFVPVHTWLPDAHSEAPSPVSALLSGALLVDAFYALLRFFQVTAAAGSPGFANHVLLVLGALSLVIASLYVLRQRSYKRLLAYSSIEHMGVIALGVGFTVGPADLGHLPQRATDRLRRVRPPRVLLGRRVDRARERRLLRGHLARGADGPHTGERLGTGAAGGQLVDGRGDARLPGGRDRHRPARARKSRAAAVECVRTNHGALTVSPQTRQLAVSTARSLLPGRVRGSFLPSPEGESRLEVPLGALDRAASLLAEHGARFVSVFLAGAENRVLMAVSAFRGELVAIQAPLDGARPKYPSLTLGVPAGRWPERELHDRFGVQPLAHPDLEPILDPDVDRLRSRAVGEDLFVLPYGPVRAGVFEAIQYVICTGGEDVTSVEVRPFFKHRGLEQRFEQISLLEGAVIAERVAGIASVAHATAFAQAVERALGLEPPRVAMLWRVTLVELERIATISTWRLGWPRMQPWQSATRASQSSRRTCCD
jgi:Proton-conducting membrane transporter/Respiratory-chain NADH dehydrogenase, 30 Kd subunit